MKIVYDTSLNYFHKIAWMIDQCMDFSRDASSLKARLNEQYNFITDRAVQIHGGVGTTRKFNIGLLYRRAKAFETMYGDTQFHYENVAKALDL